MRIVLALVLVATLILTSLIIANVVAMDRRQSPPRAPVVSGELRVQPPMQRHDFVVQQNSETILTVSNDGKQVRVYSPYVNICVHVEGQSQCIAAKALYTMLQSKP